MSAYYVFVHTDTHTVEKKVAMSERSSVSSIMNRLSIALKPKPQHHIDVDSVLKHGFYNVHEDEWHEEDHVIDTRLCMAQTTTDEEEEDNDSSGDESAEAIIDSSTGSIETVRSTDSDYDTNKHGKPVEVLNVSAESESGNGAAAAAVKSDDDDDDVQLLEPPALSLRSTTSSYDKMTPEQKKEARDLIDQFEKLQKKKNPNLKQKSPPPLNELDDGQIVVNSDDEEDKERNKFNAKVVEQTNPIIVSIGFQDNGRISINSEDMNELWFDPNIPHGHWLKNSIMDVYFFMIRERSLTPGYPKIYILQSMFFKTYQKSKETGKSPRLFHTTKRSEALERTLPSDLDTYDLIFLPINIGNSHWILAVADMRHETKTITIYDSFQEKYTHLAELSKEVINYAFLLRELPPIEFEIDTTKHSNVQTNMYDCGVFVLQNVNYLSQNKPLDDVVQQNMRYFRLQIAYEIAHKKLF